MSDIHPPTKPGIGARIFSRKAITRGLFVLACFATLVALIYAVENWRGQRAWSEVRKNLEAQGRTFDPAALVPPPVPDDQNILKAPGMESFIKGRSNTFGQVAAAALAPRHYTNRVSITAAEVRVIPPGTPTNTASADSVLTLEDPGAERRALELLAGALGPSTEGPTGTMVTARDLEQTKPVRLLIESAMPLSLTDLARVFPTNAHEMIGPAATGLRIEPLDSNSFRVTVTPPAGVIANEYLAATAARQLDFDLIRQGLTRPYSRVEGDYRQLFAMPVANFVLVRNFAQTLAQRAQCHLLLHEPEAAWQELALVLEMCRLLGPQPEDKPRTLVSAMIEVAVTGLYTQIVKDGLRLHAWHEAELTSIQNQLAQVKLLPLNAAALDSELVAVCAIFEKSPPGEVYNIFSHASSEAGFWRRLRDPLYLFFKFAPRGWVHQNLASIATSNQEFMAALDCTNNRISAARIDAFAQRQGDPKLRSSPYTWLAAISVPNFAKALQTTAKNQTRANQAMIACALEEYHLAHGRYPESLDTLVPQFISQLPLDIFNGSPVRYRPMPRDSYLLYSVGWNETDDNGIPGRSASEGDWVWQPESTSL